MTVSTSERSKHVLARVAAALWVVPRECLSFAEIEAKVRSLIRVLDGDPRIIATEAPDQLVSDFSYVTRHFPVARSMTLDALKGGDGLDVLHLSTSMDFSVRVPIKNQPVISGAKDVPSDVYRCSWDGMTLVVGWEQGDENVPLSGGHVVIEVLKEVLAKVGDSLYVQACSPACPSGFVHQTLAATPTEEPTVTIRPSATRAFVAHVPAEDLDGMVWLLHNALSGQVEEFAKAKGSAQRIRDLEYAARDDLAHLLSHYAEHAELAALPFRRALRRRWKQRAWRREAQVLMMRVWLALSGIEALRGQWAESRESIRQETAVSPAIEPDMYEDDKGMEALDLSHVEAATEHLADRIDNRAVVLATSVGALGGALSGGLVSGLFTWLN